MGNQSVESDRPRDQRQINEVLRNQQKEVHVQHFCQSKCGDRVHAHREDQAPIDGVIGQRIMFIEMTPRAQDEKIGNPPGARRPEEDREAFDEGSEFGEK